MTYKPSKVGQTDLVWGLLSELVGRSVRAGFNVSTYSGYDFSAHVNTYRPTQHTETETDSF